MDSSSPVTFTAMTCNVGNGRAKPEKLVPVIREAGANLVGIQELSETQAAALVSHLADQYPHRAVFPGGFAGKAVLSRYPLLEAEQLHLSPVRPDLRTLIDLDGRQLAFIVAHPPPPHPHLLGPRFDAETWQEIKTLAELAVSHPPAVLLGDFNLTDWSREYQHLCSTGLQDAYREAGTERGHTLPRRVGPWKRFLWLNRMLSGLLLVPMMRVDYIWYTPPLKCHRAWVGKDTGSDHLPVLAVLEL